MKGTTPFLTAVIILSVLVTVLTGGLVSAADPAISITPDSGPVRATVLVTGSGFTPGAEFNIKFDGTDITSYETDNIMPDGSLYRWVSVPPQVRGMHSITATTASETSNAVPFNVTPVIYLSSISGSTRDNLEVYVYGFDAGSIISVSFDGALMATATADPAGSFQGVFTVPPTSLGIHAIRAWSAACEAPPMGFSVTDPDAHLSGFGTATVNGIFSPGEWDSAGRIDFPVYLPEEETVTGTLFTMNNSGNLYLAARVPRSTLGHSNQIVFEFDNDNDGNWYEAGDDAILVNQYGFFDDFRASNGNAPADTNPGEGPPGTKDGQGAYANNGEFTTFELSHPLNSADDSHDFSLNPGDTVGFFLMLNVDWGQETFLAGTEFMVADNAGTNQVSVMYEDNYSYSTPGDSLSNHQVTGTQSWWATCRNSNDPSDAVVISPKLKLYSSQTFDSMMSPEPDILSSAPYQWSFPNIPEEQPAGVTLTKNDRSFTPGFDVSRSITPYHLTASGKQYLTISVTPRETVNQLWIDIYAGPRGPLTGFISNVNTASADVYVENDQSYAWISVNSPVKDRLYEFVVEIDTALSPGIPAVDFMPQVNVRLFNNIPVTGTTLGGSSAHDIAGLGTWSWTSEGLYLWSSGDHFGKSVQLTERIVGASAPAALSLTTAPVATISVDTPLSTQPVMLVQDQSGNPVSGVTVTAARGTGTGALRGTLTAVTDVAGRATFTNLGYSKSGETFSLRFTAGSLSINSAALGPLASGAATTLSIATPPAVGASVDVPLAVQPIIRITDQYGNPVRGATVTTTGISNSINSYALNLKFIGQGTISPAPGSYQRARGSRVAVTATPAAGHKFIGWVGSLAGKSNTLSFTMDKNISLTAVFEPVIITDNITYAVEHTPTSYPFLYGHQPLVESIEDATNGAIKTTIYPGSTLLPAAQTWEGVRAGTADMAWINAYMYAGRFPLSEVNMLPFLFPNATIGSKVSWEIFNRYPEIQAQWQENKILATMTSDPYFIVSPREFYRAPGDFTGKKFRAMGMSAYLVQALGGVPVAVASAECYTALERGVIDAMLIRAEQYWSWKIYEVAPYISYVPLLCDYHAIAMNKSTWNRYTPQIQSQIMSAAGATAAEQFGNAVFDRARADMVSKIQAAGGTVHQYTLTSGEKQALIDMSRDLLWDDWVADRVAQGFTNARQILNDTFALSQQYAAGTSLLGEGEGNDYTLTLKTIGQGALSPSPGPYPRAKSSVVSVNAVPAAGWKFSGWAGDVSGVTNTINFTMTDDITLTAVFEPIDIATAGTLRGTLTAVSNNSGLAAFTNLGYSKSGETVSLRFTAGNLALNSSNLEPLSAGAATQIRVETASNGSGTVVGSRTLAIGKSLKVYGIMRDQYSNYIANGAGTWSLINKTGGVVDTDLAPAADNLSATLTGHLAGTVIISISATDLASVNSGTISITRVSDCQAGGGPGGGSNPSVKITLNGLTSGSTVYTTNTGAAKAQYQLKTVDGLLSLNIASGTILATREKNALTNLSAEVVNAPPPVPANNALVTAYKLGPEGATFNPALTLTLAYDPDKLPKGVDGNNLYVAYHDGSQWQKVESTTDFLTKKVTFQITHFSIYALLGVQPTPPPAIFTVGNLIVTPNEVNPGQEIKISASVTNSGGSPGDYTVRFKVNNILIESQNLSLEAGKSLTLDFKTKVGEPGIYDLDINGKTGQVTVTALPVDATIPQPSTATQVLSPISAPIVAPVMTTANEEAPASPVFWWIIVGIVIFATGLTMGIILYRQRSGTRTK